MQETGTPFTVDWVIATRKGSTRTRRIWKRVCGIPIPQTYTKCFSTRVYKSENGDTIPKNISEYERQLSLTIGVSWIYVYPGVEPEIPTFDHIVGRRPLQDRKTLMATLLLADGTSFEIAVDKLRFVFDQSAANAEAHIVVLQKGGFMVYDGLRPQSVTVTIQDEDVKERIVKTFDSKHAWSESEAV